MTRELFDFANHARNYFAGGEQTSTYLNGFGASRRRTVPSFGTHGPVASAIPLSPRQFRLNSYRPLAFKPEALEPRRVMTSIGFVQHDIDVRAPSEVSTADFDGDGDLDLVVTTRVVFGGDGPVGGEILWYQNVDGAGTFGASILDHSLIGIDQRFTSSSVVADINGDNLPDVVAEIDDDDEERVIVWYENTGAGQTPFAGKTIGRGRLLGSADLDGDGDPDLLSRSAGLEWFENTNGFGTFSDAQTISEDRAVPEVMTDFDGDGDVDLLTRGETWLENQGSGTFNARVLQIDQNYSGWRSIDASDVDGDGDMDVVTVGMDSAGTRCDTFSQLVCYERGELEIAWYENTDGRGSLGKKQVIAIDPPREEVNFSNGYFLKVKAHDLDGDGDQDVLAVTSAKNDDLEQIRWFENLSNDGSFAEEQVIPINTKYLAFIEIADVDNDDDADLILASREDGKFVWLESDAADRRGLTPGDADGNGEVGFADFLLLSSNFGKQVDAVWADGDFNEDGQVSFEDFLILSENFSRTSSRASTPAPAATGQTQRSPFDP